MCANHELRGRLILKIGRKAGHLGKPAGLGGNDYVLVLFLKPLAAEGRDGIARAATPVLGGLAAVLFYSGADDSAPVKLPGSVHEYGKY